MKIRFYPQGNLTNNSVVMVVDENTLSVDGQLYEFDPDHVAFDPTGPILGARRDDDGVLEIEVLIKYRINQETAKATWESRDASGVHRGAEYETVTPGMTIGEYPEETA